MKKPDKRKTVFTLLITAAVIFAIGAITAYSGLIHSTLYLSESFGYRAQNNSLLFGIILTADVVLTISGVFTGLYIVYFLFSKGIEFIVVRIFLVSGGVFFINNAVYNNTKNEIGHLLTFIIFGIFFIAIVLLMFVAHFKKNIPERTSK